ncbi:MAG: hypothetical protein ACRC1T_04550 [Clostridium chrysemydis]|uniref:hypothetical protein n=1 Tax=Clostridium chrysemydis TaxID=2665504 RepID=UPI003F381CF4
MKAIKTIVSTIVLLGCMSSVAFAATQNTVTITGNSQAEKQCSCTKAGISGDHRVGGKRYAAWGSTQGFTFASKNYVKGKVRTLLYIGGTYMGDNVGETWAQTSQYKKDGSYDVSEYHEYRS